MSNKQSMQKIWYTTDKPLIDKMSRKTTQSSVTTATHNWANDSDSEESSSGYFAALPQEFRPNLNPQSTKQRTKDTSYNTKHDTNSATSKSSSYATVKNGSHDDSESERRQKQTMYPNESKQNTCFKRFLVNDECTGNKNVAPTTLNKQRVSPNYNQNSARKIENNNIPMETNSIRASETGNKIIHQEVSKETLARPMNNLFQVQKQQNTPQSNSPGRNKESRKQSECMEKPEPRTIQIDFEVPSVDSSRKEKLEYTAKFSSEKKQLNTGIPKNKNAEPVLSPSRIKYPHSKVTNEEILNVPENTIQWNSKLDIPKQKDSGKNKIQWKITEETNTNSPPRIKFKRNESRWKPRTRGLSYKTKPSKEDFSHQMPLNKKSYQGNLNNSFRNDSVKQTTVENHVHLNQPTSRLAEKKYSELISFYKNNFQEETLNYVGTKAPDGKSLHSNERSTQNVSERKNELGTQSDNELDANNSVCTSTVSDTAQLENFACHKSYGYSSRTPNCAHSEVNTSTLTNFNETEIKNFDEKDIFYYGKEMSDLIIGSYDTLSMFVAIYKEWITSRHELIDILEQLQKNIETSSKKFTKYHDIVKYAHTGAQLASAIPHPYATLAARIVSIFTTLFSNFLDKPKKAEIDSSQEITSLLFKDNQASTDLYMYGLQCNQQFEETVKIIEEFHSKVRNYEILPPKSGEIAVFVGGILEYKPTHRVFYKKLHKCFQELLQTASKSNNARFCEPFFLFSSTAIDVIGFLKWRFCYEAFSHESVQHELEQIHKLIMDSNTTSLKDLIARLQNCLRIMKEEVTFVEKNLKDVSLFDTT